MFIHSFDPTTYDGDIKCFEVSDAWRTLAKLYEICLPSKEVFNFVLNVSIFFSGVLETYPKRWDTKPPVMDEL